MTSGWAVIVTRAMCEELAAARLRAGGLRVYLPTRRVVLTGHRAGARGKSVLRPLLPGYLFAWLDEGEWIGPVGDDRWRHWRTPWDGKRAFVTETAIAILRAMEAREGEAIADAPAPGIGERVAVERSGVTIEGVVVALHGPDRRIIETMTGRRISAPVNEMRAAAAR